MSQLKREASRTLHDFGRAVGVPFERLDASRVALVLACIPVLVGPPLVAILITAGAVLADRTRARRPRWRRVPVIALVNIVVSIAVLHYLSESLWETIRDFMALIYPTMDAGPRLTPV